MHQPLPRRTLAKGIAWTVPTVAFTTTLPAFAASTCNGAIDAAFDAAQAYVQQRYYCNGEPVKLQINFGDDISGISAGTTTSPSRRSPPPGHPRSPPPARWTPRSAAPIASRS